MHLKKTNALDASDSFFIIEKMISNTRLPCGKSSGITAAMFHFDSFGRLFFYLLIERFLLGDSVVKNPSYNFWFGFSLIFFAIFASSAPSTKVAISASSTSSMNIK